MDIVIDAKSPRFSIIVPVYNSELYLERCIQSVLSQSYTNFELLLVNDGSTDTSGRICDKYAELDSRVCVYHKPNGGVSSARNMGLNNARGEWVVFCDADDWVSVDWLTNFSVDCMRADLLNQGYNSYKIDGAYCGAMGVAYEGDIQGFIERLYASGVLGYLWIKRFRRSILEQHNIRFDERFNFREDEEFVLKYLTHCKWAMSTDITGYNYYVPDYRHKYQVENNMFELCQSICQSLLTISSKVEYSYAVKLRNDITSRFVVEFCCKPAFAEKREVLLAYRNSIGSMLLLTHFFIPIRYILYFDFTGILSTTLLYLYLSAKKFLKL